MFSIFINDIPLVNEKNKNFSLLFADDLVCAFFYKPDTRDKAIYDCENYLRKLEKWSNRWRLTFAPKKSNVLVFTSKRNVDQVKLKMYNEVIPQTKEVRFLGILSILFTKTQLPKNKVLSIGGGNSYLFSWLALPTNLPYI